MTTITPISHHDLLTLLEGSFRVTFLLDRQTIVILYGYKPSALNVLIDEDCKTYLNNHRRFLTDTSKTQRWLNSNFLKRYLEREIVKARKRKLKMLVSK
jgi:hypothetical protein